LPILRRKREERGGTINLIPKKRKREKNPNGTAKKSYPFPGGRELKHPKVFHPSY